MWVKTDRGYVNLLNNGNYLCVREMRKGGTFRIVSMSHDGVSVLYVVKDGYLTEEDAQGALDELMGDAVTVREPAIEEAEEEEENN